MRAEIANEILDEYARWWREQFVVHQAGNGVEIVTPMLNRNNDSMSVFIGSRPDASDGLVLSDLGQTLGDLGLEGCDVLGSAWRTDLLDATLGRFGLSRDGGEIYVYTSRLKLFVSLDFMLQGMSAVDSLLSSS